MSRTLRLDDGTAWPDPSAVVAAFDRIPPPAAFVRVIVDIEAPMTDAERQALHDYWTIRDVVGAYDHLTRHPAGTESAVKSLRSLRRAVAKVRT